MIRATELSRSESVCRFRVEGRLTQINTPELLAVVEPVLAAGGTVLLDLARLTFADATAVETLVALRGRGVVLAGCSSFLSEMLRTGAGAAPCRRHAVDAPAEPDERFLARLRGGDDTAFAELVERNAGRMLATAKRLLRNDDEARDAVQDAFISAFKGIAAFNGEAKISTWLHRIVVNAALMRLRSGKHRAERSIDDLLPRFDEEGRWAEEPARHAASSHELLERRETRAIVRRCIDRLPVTYRTVLLMRDIEDLDTDEVADLLDITPNAVKIRLHRARQALRTLIQQELCAADAPAERAGCSAAGAHDGSRA